MIRCFFKTQLSVSSLPGEGSETVLEVKLTLSAGRYRKTEKVELIHVLVHLHDALTLP